MKEITATRVERSRVTIELDDSMISSIARDLSVYEILNLLKTAIKTKIETDRKNETGNSFSICVESENMYELKQHQIFDVDGKNKLELTEQEKAMITYYKYLKAMLK